MVKVGRKQHGLHPQEISVNHLNALHLCGPLQSVLCTGECWDYLYRRSDSRQHLTSRQTQRRSEIKLKRLVNLQGYDDHIFKVLRINLDKPQCLEQISKHVREFTCTVYQLYNSNSMIRVNSVTGCYIKFVIRHSCYIK